MASRKREVPFVLTAENRTQQAFRQLRNDVNRVSSISRQFRQGFANAFSDRFVSSFGAGLRSLVNDFDELAKSAREVGIAVGELDQLRFAGNILGVDEGQLDRIIRKLQATQARAIQGQSADTSTVDLNRAAFEALGITVDDLRNIENGRDLLIEVVRGLDDVTQEAERAGITGQLVGQRLGGGLRRAAAEGSEAFEALLQEARRLRDINEEITRSTEDIKDAYARVDRSVSGFVLRTVAETATFGDNTERTGRNISDLFSRLEAPDLTDFFVSPIRTIGEFGAQVVAVVNAQDELVEAQQRSEQAQRRVTAAARETRLEQRRISGEISTQRSNFLDVQEQDRRRREQERQRRLEIAETRELQGSASGVLSFLQRRRQRGTGEAGTASDLGRALIAAQQETSDPTEALLQKILQVLERDRAAAQLERLNELVAAGRLDSPVFS